MHRVYSQTVKRASFLLASMLLILQIAMPMTAFANGVGSPSDCESKTAGVIGDITGTADLATYDAGANKVVTGICIKSGANMFGNDKHSDVLDNGIYSGQNQDGSPSSPTCYTVSGVGTQTVSVARTGTASNSCQGISHIDVIIGDAPVDPCDLSVSTKIPANVDCVTFEVEAICSALKLKSFTNDLTGKSWADNYEVRWAETAPAATQDAYETHGSNTWPASFAEDYSGGEVTVWYWLVGPENDYISGRGMPNSGDKNAASIDIDTDCQDSITGSISGYKWNDLDGDGNVDNEPKLSGWTIFLDENDNEILDNNELSDITGNNGEYSFANLPAGEYTVCEVMQTGWEQTSPGTLDGCTSTTIDKPDEEVKRNFGNKQIPQVDFCSTTEVVGSVSNWIASNGRNHGGECFDYTVTPACSTVTGAVTKQVTPQYAQGPYRLVWREGTETTTGYQNFPATFPEDYNNGSVQITYFIVGPEKDWLVGSGLPNFWDGNGVTITVDTDCEDTPPIDVCLNIPDIQATVPDGMVVDNQGNCITPDTPRGGTISGHKFNDANGNVQREDDEETLSGWTIELSRCNDNQPSLSLFANLNTNKVTGDGTPTIKNCDDLELLDTTVTDSNGQFSFTGLESGTYWVCEVQKDGWVQTYPGKDMCWEVMVDGEECIVDFGNKAKEPGHVLGDTPTPPAKTLANTGSPIVQALIVSMSILGAASGAVAMSRKQTAGTGK